MCAGPIARDVRDAALLLTVLAQPDKRDATALPFHDVDYAGELDGSLKGLRIGVLEGLGFGPELEEKMKMQ